MEDSDFTDAYLGDFDQRKLCKNPTLKENSITARPRDPAGCPALYRQLTAKANAPHTKNMREGGGGARCMRTAMRDGGAHGEEEAPQL